MEIEAVLKRVNGPDLTTVHAPWCLRARVVSCNCGANRICLTCKYGEGAAPCGCSPEIPYDEADPDA